MTFELVLQNYLKDAYRFSMLRKDRSSTLGEVTELYDRLCNNWAKVIPDACLNKMLDDEIEKSAKINDFAPAKEAPAAE